MASGKRAISLVAAVLLLGTQLITAPASAQEVRCAGKRANIVGTSGPNELIGTSGNDVIVARGGSDTVRGRGGNDTVCGGGGNDTIRGGGGSDLLKGGSGRDLVLGGDGIDDLNGGLGRDICRTSQDARSGCENKPRSRGSNDRDSDTIPNSRDNCVSVWNSNQADNDGDGQGDACDIDDDNDGVADTSDHCPTVAGSGTNGCTQVADADQDTIADSSDNCPSVGNLDQKNSDNDAQGDACDTDDDNDGIADSSDACPTSAGTQENQGCQPVPDSDGDGFKDNADVCPNVADPDQRNNDRDSDGGDACDPDDDNDGRVDPSDNCQFVANGNQLDTDLDGQGDACDTDDDADGVADATDLCPTVKGPAGSRGCPPGSDVDADGIGDAQDNCPDIANADQANFDSDIQGDACDDNDDNDAFPDTNDRCPREASQTNFGCINPPPTTPVDSDNDGVTDRGFDFNRDGDIADPGEGADNCPNTPNPINSTTGQQLNTDGDAQGDACDPDDDNDNVIDEEDNCPSVANAPPASLPGAPRNPQADNDRDGLGDACDPDDDNDGVFDVATDRNNDGDTTDSGEAADNCSSDHNPDQTNTDGSAGDGDLTREGVQAGDVCDLNDDDDALSDSQELSCGGNPRDPNPDLDNDGLTDVYECSTFYIGRNAPGPRSSLNGDFPGQPDAAPAPPCENPGPGGAGQGATGAERHEPLRTGPTFTDTDHDGLTDYEEICGVVIVGDRDTDPNRASDDDEDIDDAFPPSDPTDANSDNDEIDDGTEVESNPGDPSAPSPAPAPPSNPVRTHPEEPCSPNEAHPSCFLYEE